MRHTGISPHRSVCCEAQRVVRLISSSSLAPPSSAFARSCPPLRGGESLGGLLVPHPLLLLQKPWHVRRERRQPPTQRERRQVLREDNQRSKDGARINSCGHGGPSGPCACTSERPARTSTRAAARRSGGKAAMASSFMRSFRVKSACHARCSAICERGS